MLKMIHNYRSKLGCMLANVFKKTVAEGFTVQRNACTYMMHIGICTNVCVYVTNILYMVNIHILPRIIHLKKLRCRIVQVCKV